MTRKIKRFQNFDITLEIKSDDFIKTPRNAQRNWVLNRMLKEWSDDVLAMDDLSKSFICGEDASELNERSQHFLSAGEIMEDWQIPVMKAMAEIVTNSHGSVLEIGYGRGIASRYIQDYGVAEHTIVECNPHVVQQCEAWRDQIQNPNIHILPGMWQDVVGQMKHYDGIFFHTYPLNAEDHLEQVVQSVTFAEHFFPTAAVKLKPGGVFSYFSSETNSLSRGHQRLLFNYFSSFSLSQVKGLQIPQDTQDAQWSDEMVIIEAVK